MASHRSICIRIIGGALLATSVFASTPALAQLTTATVRGEVAGAQAGAVVTARNVDTGATRTARVGADGSYTIVGLQPGTYDISVDGGAPQQVQLLVGQSVTLDLGVEAATAEVVIRGAPLAEVRTSEIGTNVTQRQIEDLPQNNRNFLNFAQLAPGVRFSDNEFRKTISSGGVGQDPNGESLGGPQINVFIDGVSLKSSVQQGGIIGQDASRGNPFPQLAIQEYRVLSGQFKAEYEDAGTSLVTAVTKSGGNDFEGTGFFYYTDDSLREEDFFIRERDLEEPPFERKQYGAALSGPIIQDELFFFFSYEGNDQDRSETVFIPESARTPANLARFGEFEGTFPSPFREDLAFGKITWEPAGDHRIELSGQLREENDIRSFGGQRSFQNADEIRNNIYYGNFKWEYSRATFFNEFTANYRDSTFTPNPLNPDLPGQDFEGVILIGGNTFIQEVKEQNWTLRNNATFSDVELAGLHTIKVGARVSLQDYFVNSQIFGNPIYRFRIDPAQNLDFSFPFEAQLGVGDPNLNVTNTQIGVFAQTDWEVTDRLLLNLGLRWDVETNANNNDFETSPQAAAALRALDADPRTLEQFDAKDYISTGDNRDPFYEAFQPRVGFSYDIFDDQSTVIFGGWGRYYDRNLFRNAAEEQLFRQQIVRTFFFSLDGQPRNGQPTIVFDPAYLTRQGLLDLVATRTDLNGELRVLRNDTRPPHTDQATIGIRQEIGPVQTSLSYTHIWGRDLIAYYPANRTQVPNADGFFEFIPVEGFGNVVALSQARGTNYDGIYFTAEKPYSRTSPWSFNIAYTLAFSEERGFLFNFDDPRIEDQPFVPNAGNERHKVVLSGLADLPYGFQISTLIQIASGVPYRVTDATAGFGSNVRIFYEENNEGFEQVDLRLSKAFEIGPARLRFEAEVFNLFNTANFAEYESFFGPDAELEPGEGNPTTLAGPPRTFQFGIRASF